MKRIWMSALLLLTALFAARAQAETVYDRGTMYGVMTVYEQPDSLSDVRMVYFSGTPVEVLEHSDKLLEIGVNCPRSTSLVNRLRARGLVDAPAARNVDEARLRGSPPSDSLMTILGEMGERRDADGRSINVEGVDLKASYSADLNDVFGRDTGDLGSLSASLTYSHLLDFSSTAFPGAAPQTFAPTRPVPPM